MAECREATRGLYESLNCMWMDRPSIIQVASNKPYQLTLAQDLGFEVPRTLITNDPSAVRNFYETCQRRIIYKTLSRPFITQDKQDADRPIVKTFVYTTPLEAHHLNFLKSVRYAPCIFQEYVSKRIELRITLVGQEVFAAEIHSQDNLKTMHDWRYDQHGKTIHKQHKLPDDIAKLCVNLVRRLQLTFGAIDMILTPDDRYVFLEINPTGQFGWIEHLTGLPISQAIAKHLQGEGGITL